MAVANTTELSNTAGISRVLSRVAAPALQKTPVMMGLMYVEDMPNRAGTAVKAFRREGSLTAVSLAESTARAFGAEGERTDTALEVTAAKAVVVSGVTVENQKFATGVDLDSYAESAGTAIGIFVDNQVLALFSSITNLVTATSDLTLDDLDEAQFNILNAGTPNKETQLVFVGATRAIRNLKQDIRSSGGAAYQSDRFLSIFDGPPSVNGFFGTLPGFDLYYTSSGLPTSGSNNVQAMFHPKWGFAGMFDEKINVWYANKGSEGFYTEIASHYFWAAGLWNDGACCEVQSAAS